jgi:hypothetical protein
MTWNGTRISAGVRNAIMRGLLDVASDVRNTAIDSIVDGPKTGFTYTRRSVVHVASAPGEPPAADIGTLHNSITLRPDVKALAVYVNAGAKYAAALEYGTAKMEPRPYLRPALLQHARLIGTRVAAEVRAYLASGGK